jgi:hypothetical protein
VLRKIRIDKLFFVKSIKKFCEKSQDSQKIVIPYLSARQTDDYFSFYKGLCSLSVSGTGGGGGQMA